ncbi:hypothetical protein CYMTET_21755 [Cymbomonas tetramitiformis]|uniref:Uncharacterized protein n=1 Tax=Cymbomonas tetramitiformis TaxID=36881 RepID=A0AAE0G1J1_9CHLO|nr:hypothetical protein CYMTET_21755 [Cymbomonas tetramitiformis]
MNSQPKYHQNLAETDMIFSGSGNDDEENRELSMEIKVLEAIEIYTPSKIQGVHGHFVLFGLIDNLERRLRRKFTPDEVRDLLDRFYSLERVKPDEEDEEYFLDDEEFSLPEDFKVE